VHVTRRILLGIHSVYGFTYPEFLPYFKKENMSAVLIIPVVRTHSKTSHVIFSFNGSKPFPVSTIDPNIPAQEAGPL
jgi:hypothetical protein